MLRFYPFMHRFSFLPLAHACSVVAALAAEPRETALQGMVKAERDFAALAASANTREAFLTYLADDAVMFANGPCNGRELYANRPADDSLLVWEPSFADMAASGDFGYDTGPYTHRQKRSDEKPQRAGQFVTVWRKIPAGDWRVSFDTGCPHPVQETPEVAKLQFVPAASGAVAPGAGETPRESLLAAERNLISSLKQNGASAYPGILAPEARRLRRGFFPAISAKSFHEQVLKFSGQEKYGYDPIEAAVASSGDLGYVYGWIDVEMPAAEKTEPARSRPNYLRIWKRENGKNWKLVLELTGTH